jgi:CPA2 family monovalent cation:H+ antiporter-2
LEHSLSLNSILFEIAIIFIIASILGLITSKFRQPAIFAYIFAGIILGPGLLGFIKNAELIDYLAEIGVIALLFTLGLEFSFDKFKEIKNHILFAGIMQIGLTITFVGILVFFLGFNITQCVLIGSIVALSSTVVVLKTLTDNAQIDSVHGRIILGILIIQDISLIPIMIILSNITGESGSMLIPLLSAILKAGVFLGLALFVSLKLTPMIMNLITSTNKEMLIIASVGVAIGTAVLGTYFGISLELGAFVAGLSLSVTVHSKQVVAEIMPFRDVFAMVFFVSIGMMMDTNLFFNKFLLVIAIVSSILLIKFVICFMVVFIIKYPGQTALWAGFSLLQIGEFSFIIAKLGFSKNIISEDIYSLTIISTLITMMITPFVVKAIPSIIISLQKVHFWNKYFKGQLEISHSQVDIRDHVIIAGFGPIGRSIAKILSLNNEKYIVIELNNNTIQDLKKQNVYAIYGDATHPEIIEHANIEHAKIVIITLPDVKSCEMATINSRRLHKNVYIIVRARYQSHIEQLYQAGANVVVYEEYETSLGIMVNALEMMNYSRNEIETIAKLVQSNQFEILKETCKEQVNCRTVIGSLRQNEIEWIKVSDNHWFANKSISESNIRKKTGVSIISITKNGESITNPSPETVIENGDIIAVIGQKDQIESFFNQ